MLGETEGEKMTEEEWLASSTLSSIIGQLQYATPRKRRLYCVACCWRIMCYNHNPIVREALAIAERYADGWERRERVVSASQRIGNILNETPSWFTRQPTTYAAQAVAEVCRLGTEYSPESVFCWITETLEHDSADVALEELVQCVLLRDIFGNPFRPPAFDPAWRTDTALTLARQMYDSRDFGAMPILADALQDTGCENEDILSHCRGEGPHVRGCWVVDLVLGKE